LAQDKSLHVLVLRLGPCSCKPGGAASVLFRDAYTGDNPVVRWLRLREARKGD